MPHLLDDLNGKAFDDAVKGADSNSEPTAEWASEAARIRSETPEPLEQAIGEMEQGINPDERATEGLSRSPLCIYFG